MPSALYDTIGQSYNATRRADPYLAERLYSLLAPKPDGLYLDIGCGTANYLTALAQKGLRFVGVDPSQAMLKHAMEKDNGAAFICASAESLPLEDELFDGATATLTLHHWADKVQGLKEVNRVLKPGARLVFLSFTPEQMKGYWLNHYFPVMMRRSREVLPDLPVIEEWLKEAGFRLAATEKYFIQDDLQDHFLYSNKRRPAEYLKAEIRNNASGFRLYSTPEEMAAGLKALEADIASGEIWQIIKSYDNDKGDYLFLVAVKVNRA